MQKQSIIICGSRNYGFNVDDLVDGFDVIVRHNMLVPNCGYGKKESSVQVMNSHVYQNYKKKISLSKWISDYSSKTNNKEHIKKFYDYINSDTKTKFLTYSSNNKPELDQICRKNNLIKLKKEPKCGLGHIARSIKNKNKPFLVGYSVDVSTIKDHHHNTHKKMNNCHDHLTETKLLSQLHEKGLVDARFCFIDNEQQYKEELEKFFENKN